MCTRNTDKIALLSQLKDHDDVARIVEGRVRRLVGRNQWREEKEITKMKIGEMPSLPFPALLNAPANLPAITLIKL